MNRREIFKGAAGAATEATLAGGSSPAQNFPPQPPDLTEAFRQVNQAPKELIHIPDPASAIKQAMFSKAREEAERQEQMLNRKRMSLQRLQSVSQAWIDSQMELCSKEQTAIWKRFEEARKFIFG